MIDKTSKQVYTVIGLLPVGGRIDSAPFLFGLTMDIPEVFTYIVTPILLGIGAVWGLIAWYAKQVTPAKIKASDDKLRAQLASLEDSREHRQAIETEEVRLNALNTSWANEKLFEEAHENNVFIRGDVSSNLNEIKAMLRNHELKQAALESKFSLFIGIFAELRDDVIKLRGEVAKLKEIIGTLTNEH